MELCIKLNKTQLLAKECKAALSKSSKYSLLLGASASPKICENKFDNSIEFLKRKFEQVSFPKKKMK